MKKLSAVEGLFVNQRKMKEIDKIIAELAKNPKRLMTIEPREFEEIVAEIMAGSGYDVQLTQKTRDGGYDIMAIRKDSLGLEASYVVECKRYRGKNKVGIVHIRELYGIKSFLGISNGILVTTSKFTKGATLFAKSKYDIQLIDFAELVEWIRKYSPLPEKVPYITTRKFHSCFIAHSHIDKKFVQKLNSSLREMNIRVWYAPEKLMPGKKIREQIREAIKSFDKILLILSKNSMQSEWVKTEIRDAIKREKEEKRQVLFPISVVPMEEIKKWECFDADSGKDLAVEIREYYIPDFSQWQNDEVYKTQLSKLLEGLQGSNKVSG